MLTIIKDTPAAASESFTCLALKAAIFIAPKAALKVTLIAAPKVIWKIRSSIVALNISSIIASKIALKPILKPKFIRALKSRVVIKSKLARIIKYKDKTTKLYTSYTYSAKAPAIRNGQGAKFKNKLSKAIIPISGRESLFSNNINIEDNNKDKLIVI